MWQICYTINMKKLEYYTTETGKCPYIEWYEKLTPIYQAKILTRLDRLLEGNKGDFKQLKNSKLSELRLHFGSGYRIYFKEFGDLIILIIAGSDKSEQEKTIQKANKYFEDYLKRRNNENDN